MSTLTPILFSVAFIILFWGLTVHNIGQILTRKYSAKKNMLYSILGLAVIIMAVESVGLIEIFILIPFDSFSEILIRIITNMLDVLIMIVGIYISTRLLYKENRSTVVFISSFYLLVGVIICDIVVNYVNYLLPNQYGTMLYYLTIGLIILIVGGIIAIIVRLLIAPAMKDLIKNVSGQLREFVWVSVVGVLTYLPMIVYFNTIGSGNFINTQIISRIIFLCLFITIYLIIIYGVKKSVKNIQILNELSLAKEIMMQILPSRSALDEIPCVKIAALINPCGDIGADFYDAFIIDDEKSAFIIADVDGKGIPAALFMVQVKSILKVNLRIDKMPDYVLTAANFDQIKKKQKSSMYYGAVVSTFERSTRKFTYSCGGHIPPFLIRNGSVTECSYSGESEIGISDIIYPQFDMILEKDDVIFFYTDGIIDTVSMEGKHYGKERLINVISKETEPDKMIAAVADDIDKFSKNCVPSDDVTMLAFKVL